MIQSNDKFPNKIKNLTEDIELAKKCASSDNNGSIGTKKEHSLHRTLKYLIDPTGNYHEQKIDKKIVDVYLDNVIYEIQTKSFNLLRNKLEVLLKNHYVRIIYPCVIKKYIYKINSDGEIISYRKSPKVNNPIASLKEFYKIKNYLDNENLEIDIILVDIDEYQQIVDKSYRNRHGKLRIEQVLRTITGKIFLKNKEDYLCLLKDLPETFTTKEFTKILKIDKSICGYIIAVLKYLNLIEVNSKIGRSFVYKIVK